MRHEAEKSPQGTDDELLDEALVDVHHSKKGPTMPADQSLMCLVINLDGSDDRWRSVCEQLDNAGMCYTRLPAVDGRKLNLSEIEDYNAVAAKRYMGRALVGGEIGCYRSHIKAARAFIDSDATHCLVLEDDCRPDPELAHILKETTHWLDAADPQWRIVNLGNPKLKIATEIHSIATKTRSYVLCRAFYFPMTTGAILWSRAGAMDFLAQHGDIFAPVDNFLRHWITRAGGGYAFSPRPVDAAEVASDISSSPRSRENRSLLYGFRKQRRLLIDKWIATRQRRRASGLPGPTGA